MELLQNSPIRQSANALCTLIAMKTIKAIHGEIDSLPMQAALKAAIKAAPAKSRIHQTAENGRFVSFYENLLKNFTRMIFMLCAKTPLLYNRSLKPFLLHKILVLG